MQRYLAPLVRAARTFESRATAITRRTFTARPRTLIAVVALLSIGWFTAGASLAYLTYDLTSGLPDRQTLRGMGDMVQSTTIFDAKDRPAFTIFKEQRIEVPLDRISPNLINAVISVEDQRFYDHGGID